MLDADTSECLHYEPMAGYPPKNIARIPREILDEHQNIEIRNDFIDCSIDVCSVEVCSPVLPTSQRHLVAQFELICVVRWGIVGPFALPR